MNLSHVWSRLRLRDLGRKRIATRSRVAVRSRVAAQIESMETRQLLSGSALFIPATGELSIGLNSAESVRVSSLSGSVLVEVSTGTGGFVALTTLGNVPASSVQSIVILGGDEANTINLNGVTAVNFTRLTSISIDGANGHDTIIGSPDFADNIIGGHGNDTINGQGGSDTINGGDSNDSISGGTGDDSIIAGDGDDSVTGEDGNDSIAAGNGQDTVSGGAGDDNIAGANGQDSIDGDAGNDTLNGDGGTDTINGGDGNDSILGGEFNDSLDGGAGDDTMSGQSGNDTVDGNRGNDVINGNAGDDAVLGGAGRDTVNGNAGNDRVFGDSGDDLIFGGAGNDLMQGMAGNDSVFGQAGSDDLCGGSEFDVSFDADMIDGGDGQDTITSVCPPLLDMDITDVTVTEGTGGSTVATFTLTLSKALEFNVSTEYVTRDGSAFAGQDYTAQTGFIFFAAGTTMQTLSINVTPDMNFDAAASENFFIDLINPERARLLRFEAEGTIIDDDMPPPPPLVDLVILLDDSADTEAAGPNLAGLFVPLLQTLQSQFLDSIAVGVARYEVYSTTDDRPFILNQPLLSVTDPQFTNAITAALARTTPGNGGGAVSTGIEALFQVATGAGFDGNDMLGTGESGPAGLVQTQLVPGTSGDVPSFGSFVADPTGPVVTPTNRNAPDGIGFRPNSLRLVMMVTDNAFFFVDEAAASYIGVDNVVVPASAIEVDGTATTVMGAATFSNTLAALLADNIRVIGLGGNQTVDDPDPNNAGTAPRQSLTALSTLTGGTNRNGLVLPSGLLTPSAMVPRAVPMTPDDIQPDEELYFGIDADDGQSIVDAITNGTFGSLDPVNVSVNVATSIELDTGSRTATFTISIDNFSRQDVTVDYSFLSGTAVNGVDFTGIGGTVTFLGSANGTPELQKTITVDILGDELFEPTETFSLVLSNPSLNALIALDPVTMLPLDTTVGTILDDDPAPDAGDVFNGGEGNDLITGFTNNDTINGGNGNDTIFGGEGNDVLNGGQNMDSIDGQLGDDTLDGQGGDDTLIGGDGNDTFLSIGSNGGKDTVDGNDGLNTITKLGTGNAETITVKAVLGEIVVGQGGSSITAGDNIQFVNVNALGGDDTITIGDLTGVRPIGVVVNGGDGNDFISGQGALLGGVRLAINGENGNDTLVGTEGDDTILAGLGNDAVNGRAGNDIISGIDGNDTLAGGLGNDTISGGIGNDFLTGQAGDDDITAGSGNDTLRGFEGNDTLQGQAGNDALNGMDGDDSILGGTGLDSISGGAGNDVLDGGRNDDVINGNSGNDRIRGDHGNDYIDAGTEMDTVNGGDGHDTIIAADGGDLLNGGDGNDRINAGGGSDTITGGDGNDSVQGGGGGDVILGGDGDDYIDGQGGRDTIAGNQGIDIIIDFLNEDQIDELFVLSSDLLIALEATG
ncbi:MAG: Calx-beta domain-containing protein [Planctomycetaceae bacterium]